MRHWELAVLCLALAVGLSGWVAVAWTGGAAAVTAVLVVGVLLAAATARAVGA